MRPDEGQIQIVEVIELALGSAVQEQLVPLLRPRIALVFDRQGFGVPVRDVEVRLLQVQHVNKFVLEHAGPVVFLRHVVGRSQGHHLAGAGSDRADVRQPDHAGAEPAVTAGVAGPLKDLEQRLARRLELKLLNQHRVNFFFQILGGVLGQDLVLGPVELDYEVRASPARRSCRALRAPSGCC